MASSPDVSDPTRPVTSIGVENRDLEDLITLIPYDRTLMETDPTDFLHLETPVPSIHSERAAQAHASCMQSIRQALLHGRTVILRGWSPQHGTTWSPTSIQGLRGSLNQTIQYQFSAEDDIHQTTLGQFYDLPCQGSNGPVETLPSRTIKSDSPHIAA